MNTIGYTNKNRHLGTLAYHAGRVSLALAFAFGMTGGIVQAAPLAATAPSLGAAGSFSVLGFSTVTNTGTTNLSGDVGVWSGPAISDVGTLIVGGATHITDSVAQQAQADASAADGFLLGQAMTENLGALDGVVRGPGVYDLGAGSLGGGVLTLNGPGVYIFRTTSTLVSAGSVSLINGANACDVYWHVATAATISGSFVGTIIAGSGIHFGTGASLNGRALAIGADVTMDGNSISGPSCAAAATSGGGASYVSVNYVCVDDGSVTVTVIISDYVVVTGLGEPMTSPDNNATFVRNLPAGHYAWHAEAQPGFYMQDNPDGDVDSAFCAPASAAAEEQVLIPNTGADRTEGVLTAGQWIPMSLGFLSLGLGLLGFALRRKQAGR